MGATIASKAVGALVFLLAAAGPVRAQSNDSPRAPVAPGAQGRPMSGLWQGGSRTARLEDGPVFRADARRVVCYTTVRDRKQRAVHDLPQSAFTVYEDGRAQPIRMFGREDAPVSLGLVIDNSRLMTYKRASAVTASLALVRASKPDDEVFVVNFHNEAYLDLPAHVDFTSDIREMEKALARLDARGEPLIRDAVRLSIQHLVEKSRREKKVLVVITTGLDGGSLSTAEELNRLARQSGVLIYAIGLLEHLACRTGEARRALEALAEATGGEAFFPKNLSEMEATWRRIARDIREQYVIAYAPSGERLDGGFRRISIQAAGPGQPLARTRSGYYASPEVAR